MYPSVAATAATNACSRSNGDFSLLEAVDLNLVLIAFFAAATLALLMFDVEDDGLSSAAAGACDVDDDLVSMDDSEQAEDDEDSQDDDFADCFESAQSYVPAHRPKGAPVADGRPARAASDNSRRPGAAWPDDGDAQDVRAAAAAARRERDLDALFDRSASRRRAVSSTSSSWARDEDDVVPGARVSAAPRAAHAPVTYRAEYRLSPAVCAAVCAAAGRDDCGEMTLDVGQDELVAALEAARSILMLELEAAKKQREKFERERERERRTFTDDAPAPAIERAAAAPAPAPTRSKAARRAPRRPAAPEPPPAAPPAAEAPSSRAAAADARVPDAAAPPGPARDTTRQEAASSKEDKGDASAPASDDAAAFAAAEAAQASAAQLKRQRQKERRLEAEQASRLCRDEAKRTAAAKRSVANAAARERAKDLVEAEAVTRAAAEEQRRRETASAWKQTQREESDQIARAVASAEEARRQSARAFDTAAAAAKLKVVSQRSARKAKMAEARPAPKVSHDESWAQPDYGYAPDADPPRTRQHVAARHDYFEYRAEEGYRTNRADEDYRQNEGFAGNDLRTAAMNSLADLANAPAPRHEHAHGYSQQQRHCGYAPFAGERFESDGFSDVFAAEPFADDSSFSAPQPYVPPQQYAGFGDTAWSPHAQQSAGFPGQAAPFAGQGPQFSGQAARPRWQGAYESPYGASLLQAGLDDTLRRSLVDADGDALQRAADAIFDRASSPQGGGESAPDDDASRSTMRATAKEFTLHHGQHAPPPGLSRGQDRFANDSRFAGDRYEDQRY
ncbi:hypothetical protein M885DRAFT_504207 [Pelagophyceae sp. CCMP2097]|nr:hypothetical protein M885DRAFT_504207 [Pelagophyceae sp. CCMP2097]